MGIKDIKLEWLKFGPEEQIVINKRFEGITINIEMPLFKAPPIEPVDKPERTIAETDERVISIMNHMLDKSGIVYTDDDRVMGEICGFMLHFFAAFYNNSDRQQPHPFLPSSHWQKVALQYDLVGIRNTEHPMLAPMGTRITSARRMSLFFHEMAHATGKASRLNRKGVCEFTDRRESAIEEIIAETTAKRMMHHFGMGVAETDEKSDVYLKTHFSMFEESEHEFIKALTGKHSDLAMAYMLQQWLEGYAQEQKVA